MMVCEVQQGTLITITEAADAAVELCNQLGVGVTVKVNRVMLWALPGMSAEEVVRHWKGALRHHALGQFIMRS